MTSLKISKNLLPSANLFLPQTRRKSGKKEKKLGALLLVTTPGICNNIRYPSAINVNQSSNYSIYKKFPLEALAKADLVSLDAFYRKELPLLLHQRDPDPFLTKSELVRLMKWKLSRGKRRPRLLDFVSSLGEEEVELASKKAFASLPDLSKAISNLTVLKGVGPATASAILAVYAPDIAPFMSDEALMAAMGKVKEYTLKQYILFAEKLEKKAKELSGEGECFTVSDVERALWSSAVGSKLQSSSTKGETGSKSKKGAKRKRKN